MVVCHVLAQPCMCHIPRRPSYMVLSCHAFNVMWCAFVCQENVVRLIVEKSLEIDVEIKVKEVLFVSSPFLCGRNVISHDANVLSLDCTVK